MIPEMALEQQTALTGWEAPSPPTDLIFDDGVPLESNRHRIAMNVLIRSTQQVLQAQPNTFVGGNMFVYYSRTQAMNRDFRGPDFFAVLGVESDRERQGWVVWEEDGRYPDVIVELLSPSTAAIDKGIKKDLYERVFKTPDYFVFDPFDPSSLAGWRLDLAQGYQPLSANEQGWLWCQTLGLWFGAWEGALDREPMTGSCQWLRLYDSQGNLILLPEEAAQQRAEQEKQRAEQEKQRAEQEKQRTEQEKQRAEQEKQRADRLAEKLKEFGIDPSTL